MARGYDPENTTDYPQAIKITSLYDLQKMIAESDKIISITR
jgi:sulfur relay (sulfurtransferase) complex TusBCD TusD component (DsrE family)